MLYGYECANCGEKREVVKPVAEYNSKEYCKSCNCLMTKDIAPRKIHLFGTAVQDKKFQPAIGKVATDSEMRAIAKEKGWTEIGNERQDKHIQTPYTEYPDLSDNDIKDIVDKL